MPGVPGMDMEAGTIPGAGATITGSVFRMAFLQAITTTVLIKAIGITVREEALIPMEQEVSLLPVPIAMLYKAVG